MKNRDRKFTKYCGISGSHIKNAGYSRIRITGIKKSLLASSKLKIGQGCPWFHSCEFFAKQKYSKLKNVHGCTFLSGSRPASQAEAKIEVPEVRTVVVP
ncbi:hypothetical protein E4N83_09850 [Treponema denticola]|uniref:hypothetical protein n=1 Tax=Treponema denticola TaxID=158 RepID=UPI0020A302B6|nr:hypothetical protein [Treponema denticola]UTC98547.1 hypothetical protein E4N83_09850 [Treponema denticola]